MGTDLKLKRGKLTTFKSDNCNLVLVGAGHADFIKMTGQKIINAIGETPTHYDLYKTIEGVILEVFSKHIRHYPVDGDQKPNFDLLIGAWTRDEGLEVFKTSGTAINYSGYCECLGWGAALGGYLADKRYIPYILGEEECLGLAVYILRQAKDYVPYCGKESSVHIMRSDGTCKSASSSKVVEQELYFDDFDETVNQIFMSGYLETDDQKFEESLKSFNERLRGMRTELKEKRDTKASLYSMFFGEPLPKSGG